MIGEIAMKNILILSIFALILGVVSAVAQKPTAKDFVVVTTAEDNATAELTRMPIGVSSVGNATDIGIMYFGPNKDSDISFILFLKPAKNRYSVEGSYGIRFYTDDVALKQDKVRDLSKVANDKDNDRLHFYLTSEEVAWLATGSKFRIELVDVKLWKTVESIQFSNAAAAEFKRFARSILLINSVVD